MKPEKQIFVTIIIASVLAISVVIIKQKAQAQDTNTKPTDTTSGMMAGAVGVMTNSQGSSPIFVTEIPPGYRDWQLISVAHEAGKLNDIRAILGNDIAIKAYRDGALSFPDGTIIARLAWDFVPSEENNKLFGVQQSFVAGPPKNGVQFMVKDSKKYASTGGWEFGHFNHGKPASEAFMQSCYPCHQTPT